MLTKIDYDYVNRVARKNRRLVDINYFLHYLTIVGLCHFDKAQNALCAEDSVVERIEKMLDPIAAGNIVLVFHEGMFVVIDIKPAANPDGNHFRGIKVALDEHGSWRIDTSSRSKVFSVSNTLNFATSKFDVPLLNQYSYDRYVAFNQVARLNDQLRELRG